MTPNPGDEVVYVRRDTDPMLPDVLVLGQTYVVETVDDSTFKQSLGGRGWICYVHDECDGIGITLIGVGDPCNGHSWCSNCFRRLGDETALSRLTRADASFEEPRRRVRELT